MVALPHERIRPEAIKGPLAQAKLRLLQQSPAQVPNSSHICLPRVSAATTGPVQHPWRARCMPAQERTSPSKATEQAHTALITACPSSAAAACRLRTAPRPGRSSRRLLAPSGRCPSASRLRPPAPARRAWAEGLPPHPLTNPRPALPSAPAPAPPRRPRAEMSPTFFPLMWTSLRAWV